MFGDAEIDLDSLFILISCEFIARCELKAYEIPYLSRKYNGHNSPF